MKINNTLKRKNILLRDIDLLMRRAERNNSIIEGNTRAYSAITIIEEIENKYEELIGIKSAINLANREIQYKIFRISEIRSLISFYKTIDTKEGLIKVLTIEQKTDKKEALYKSDSEVSQLEVGNRIDSLYKELDHLQDEIDEFNYVKDIGF